LYRLLTGRAPYQFTDHSPAAVANRITDAKPDPSGLEAPLDAIVTASLNKDPLKRYQSAEEMSADLARYLEGEQVHARRPRTWPKAMAAAAIVVLIAIATWMLLHRKETAASIAVLPFASLTPDSAYLGNGLTDEITDSLSRLKSLRVIARTSVAQFTGNQADFRRAGRELDVANILEGTVTRDGATVRISARLERVSDGTVLWSNSYETTEQGLAGVQSELTSAVARKLNLAPLSPGAHTPNPEAHELVMKGIYEAQKLTPEALEQAEADFQRAIDLDPQYARAYLQLGVQKYNESAAKGSAFTSRTEAERKTLEQLIRKALSLDPNLPNAHAMLAMLAMQYDWDWKGAERELQLGSAGFPSPLVEQIYATLLLFRGHTAEADEHIRRAQDLDPFQVSTLYNIASLRLLEGRYAETRALAQKMAAVSPKMFAAKILFSGCDILENRTDQALEETREWKRDFPGAQMFEAMALARAGQKDEALRLMRPFEGKYPNPGVALEWFALVYGILGDEPNTVKWLQRSADQREWQVLNLAINPVFASVRNSPDFQALEKRMGFR
jgi:TolB-like protein/Tfp pilus assembly protein PilF